MRSIKFRAYQKNAKRMLPVVNIGFDSNGIIESVSVDNNGCNGEYNVSPRLHTFYKGDNIYNLELLELMQFTGLTDKNGKEIYEGDKVIHPVYSKSTIIYSQKYLGLAYEYIHYFNEGNIGEPMHEVRICPLCGDIFLKDLELIGNIHDNPELLK
ncbi:hypothetical protein JGH11_19380 [Dysgonomonas sp. Marseille-P4677]|uniref:YopX family protein n=1 Tax=Dysgonomonas sp. Marseille-P4677 TaxID=2364790 RepID=UPI001914162A|nr:YopX family protein [Dysgonomonas sp. Marseille-P4677]MBK5723035.1 hypothetical protein [Dysgonomonas sp. Marseille-P4677]